MPSTEPIEAEIRHLLATESDAVSLSNRLFGPDGLFGKLASSQAERRILAQSTLFRDGQQRLSELRRQDAREFSQLVAQVHQARNGKPSSIRMGSV